MFRLSVTALLLGLLSGCGSPTAPPFGVDVRTELSDSTVLGGETVWVSVAVINRSVEDVVVTGSSDCFAWLEVRRMSDLELVYRGDARTCDMAAVRHSIAPGSDLVDHLPLPATAAAAGLGPGVYRIRGGTRIEGHGIAWSSSHVLKVVTD